MRRPIRQFRQCLYNRNRLMYRYFFRYVLPLMREHEIRDDSLLLALADEKEAQQ